MGKEFDPNKTINLQWYTDSETGERVLVDEVSKKIIGRWTQQKICPLCGKIKEKLNG